MDVASPTVPAAHEVRNSVPEDSLLNFMFSPTTKQIHQRNATIPFPICAGSQ